MVNYFLDILYQFIIINDHLHFSSYFRQSKILSDINGRRTLRGPTDDVRDNNAFLVEILSTLKAIKSYFECHVINRMVTARVISYLCNMQPFLKGIKRYYLREKRIYLLDVLL